MNVVRIIEKKFQFLLRRGFQVILKRNNLEDCVIYRCAKKNIVITYDLRTRIFDIALVRDNFGNINTYISLFDTSIGEHSLMKEIQTVDEQLNFDNKQGCILSPKNAHVLIDLCAQFVEANIEQIMVLDENKSNQEGQLR